MQSKQRHEVLQERRLANPPEHNANIDTHSLPARAQPNRYQACQDEQTVERRAHLPRDPAHPNSNLPARCLSGASADHCEP